MFEVNSLRKGMPFWTKVILSFLNRQELVRQRLRYIILRCAFKSCGERVTIKRNVWFVYPEYIEVGDDVLINNSCFFEGGKGIKIGNHVQFAHCVSIVSMNHSFDKKDLPIKKQGFTGGPVEL